MLDFAGSDANLNPNGAISFPKIGRVKIDNWDYNPEQLSNK